jgi:hypothetical protein
MDYTVGKTMLIPVVVTSCNASMAIRCEPCDKGRLPQNNGLIRVGVRLARCRHIYSTWKSRLNNVSICTQHSRYSLVALILSTE